MNEIHHTERATAMPQAIKRVARGLAEFVVGCILLALSMVFVCLIFSLVTGTIGYVFGGGWLAE